MRKSDADIGGSEGCASCEGAAAAETVLSLGIEASIFANPASASEAAILMDDSWIECFVDEDKYEDCTLWWWGCLRKADMGN